MTRIKRLPSKCEGHNQYLPDIIWWNVWLKDWHGGLQWEPTCLFDYLMGFHTVYFSCSLGPQTQKTNFEVFLNVFKLKESSRNISNCKHQPNRYDLNCINPHKQPWMNNNEQEPNENWCLRRAYAVCPFLKSNNPNTDHACVQCDIWDVVMRFNLTEPKSLKQGTILKYRGITNEEYQISLRSVSVPCILSNTWDQWTEHQPAPSLSLLLWVSALGTQLLIKPMRPTLTVAPEWRVVWILALTRPRGLAGACLRRRSCGGRDGAGAGSMLAARPSTSPCPLWSVTLRKEPMAGKWREQEQWKEWHC